MFGVLKCILNQEPRFSHTLFFHYFAAQLPSTAGCAVTRMAFRTAAFSQRRPGHAHYKTNFPDFQYLSFIESSNVKLNPRNVFTTSANSRRSMPATINCPPGFNLPHIFDVAEVSKLQAKLAQITS